MLARTLTTAVLLMAFALLIAVTQHPSGAAGNVTADACFCGYVVQIPCPSTECPGPTSYDCVCWPVPGLGYKCALNGGGPVQAKKRTGLVADNFDAVESNPGRCIYVVEGVYSCSDIYECNTAKNDPNCRVYLDECT